jgi:hypothetical protein
MQVTRTWWTVGTVAAIALACGVRSGFDDNPQTRACTPCGTTCTNTQVDPTNCGACGVACKQRELCSSGACSLSCGGGTTLCNGACVDTQVDPANCGACSVVCKQGELCSRGACGLSCSGGTTLCNTACVDTQVDPVHCGACGISCASHRVCAQGSCVCDTHGTLCNNDCIDTTNDPKNCGACGNVCSGVNNATATCSAKACGFKCDSGFLDCNGKSGDGCEVNADTDTKNCGSCNNVCPDNLPACVAGKCVLPQGCAIVNNVVWCMDNQIGRSCETICTAFGIGNPTISDQSWFDAQSTQPLCTQLGQAFGLGFMDIANYSYACAEVQNGMIQCSTFVGCPSYHRTDCDTGLAGICPCR